MASCFTDDWARFDPTAYLEEYYADLGAENLALLRFLEEAYRDLPSNCVLLDFGGGPTIYPLIAAASRVEEIHFTDYLDSNLEEVRKWLAAVVAGDLSLDEFKELVEGEKALVEMTLLQKGVSAKVLANTFKNFVLDKVLEVVEEKLGE